MDCPACERRRLEYRVNLNGDVVEVRCEKCAWDSDDPPPTADKGGTAL